MNKADLKCLMECYNRALELNDAQRERLEKAEARIAELESQVPKQSDYFETSQAQES